MPKEIKIDTKHPEYEKYLSDWQKVEDCIAGQETIKENRELYLPSPGHKSEKEERYKSYLQRATFLNFTGETRKNLIGQCFAIDPVFTGPEEFEMILESIDGAGVSAIQQAKCALGNVLSDARAGLFIDYPTTDAPASLQDTEQGNITAKVILHDAKSIINWDTMQRGAKTITSFVMLEEDYIESDNGYDKEICKRWRELRLIDDIYVVKLWKLTVDEGFMLESETMPLDSTGQPFNEIPFEFIGVDANNATCERSLLIDIANVNISHYVNSADYEEMVHVTGQPTPWASGLDQNWIDNVLEGEMRLGSRAVIPLPINAQVGFLQVEATTLPKEAMDQKEEHARQLGAKLVERKEVAITATEKNIDQASRSSILASVASNVSDAYHRAFNWVAQYTGVVNEGEGFEQGATFELNTEFAINKITNEERAANREDFNAGLIDFEEARTNLKEGGVASKDDEDVKEANEARDEAEFQRAQEAFQSQNNNAPDNE